MLFRLYNFFCFITLRYISIDKCFNNYFTGDDMGSIFNNFNDDTICAIATAMSDAGIGIIRVSITVATAHKIEITIEKPWFFSSIKIRFNILP